MQAPRLMSHVVAEMPRTILLRSQISTLRTSPVSRRHYAKKKKSTYTRRTIKDDANKNPPNEKNCIATKFRTLLERPSQLTARKGT